MARLPLALLAALALLCCCANAALAHDSGAEKTVRYRGYSIAVPAQWPVFDLNSHPRVCVRFNRHAVYLGRPSSAQRCPAHAVGRTEAILVQPLAAGSARAADMEAEALPAVTSQRAQPQQGSSTRLALPSAGVVVTATWGSRPGAIMRALGARAIARGMAVTSARAAAGGAAAAGPKPAARPQAVRSQASAVYTGLGFDACSAPSEDRMSAWSGSAYGAVGIYIGGTNMACAQSNLSASWVSDESVAGWRFVPTYVGLQAPRNDCGCAAIDPSRASAEGAAAATDAVTQATAVGLGAGNPIYVDMEGYTRSRANTSAVLAFLSAWTSQLHAQGYQSGVYSSANSGIRDLVSARGTGVDEPDDIWIADWNGEQSTASPYVPSGDWSNHDRLHQYEGGHNETHGGVEMNVDSNYLDGATAAAGAGGGAPPIPDGTFVQVTGSQDIYEVAGGSPLYVSAQFWNALGTQPLTVISQQEFNLLNAVPANGTLLRDSNGVSYRVAGGAPLFVSDPSVLGDVQPVTVDQRDVANLGDPSAHLNAVPANGTFLTTTTGAIYRVAGGTPFAVGNWSLFGGVQPSVTVDQSNITDVSDPGAHLIAVPRDGTAVEGLPSRSYWVFAAGRRRLTSASLAAVQVDDAGLAAFPAIPCVVPRLRQLSLLRARRVLQRADCRLGRVHVRRLASSARGLRVVSQTAQPGVRHAANYAVSVTLG